MQVTVKSWHAVASWTWTSEDDVCGICHMPLDGCAPGAPGPGDDSPVVWGRVRTIRRAVHMLSLPGHSFPRLVVLALLPPHVHQHLAAQQEHLPDLPAEVGVRQVRSLTPPPPPPPRGPSISPYKLNAVVRRSQLQRRPARREAPQQTADRREADFGLRHAPRPGRIGFLPFSAFSPCGYLFPVCTSSVNEYDGIQSGRGLAAHCTHVDTRKYEGNHTRTHLPPRASPRRRASIERVCARGGGPWSVGEMWGGSGFWAVGAGAGSGSRRAGDPVSNQEAADQGGSNMEGKIGSSPPAVQGRECVRWRPASRRAQTEEACFRSARAACRALVQEVSECWLFTARRDGDGGCVCGGCASRTGEWRRAT